MAKSRLPKSLRNFSDAPPSEGSSKRPTEGVYDIIINKSVFIDSDDGGTLFLLEYEIEDIIKGGDESRLLQEGGDSRAPYLPAMENGDVCAWFQGLKWDTAKGRLKALLLPAFQELDGKLYDPSDIGDQELEDATDEDEQPLAGVRLRVRVGAKARRDNEGYSHTYKWELRPDSPALD